MESVVIKEENMKNESLTLFNPINKLVNNRIIVNGIIMTIQEFRTIKEGVK